MWSCEKCDSGNCLDDCLVLWIILALDIRLFSVNEDKDLTIDRNWNVLSTYLFDNESTHTVDYEN